MKNFESPYYYISKYRSELMGFSILWVVWFHSALYLNKFPIGFMAHLFEFLKSIGYGGVDIFLLVSGLGIYNSLKKHNIYIYIYNRIVRIIPVWLTYLLICLLCNCILFNEKLPNIREIFGFITFTGYWLDMDNQGNWYVYAIVFFYLISPVIFSVINEKINKKLTCIELIVISFLVLIPFIGNSKLIVFSRLPIYIFGMYLNADLKKIKISKKIIYLLTCLLVLGNVTLWGFMHFFDKYLWGYGLWWYPFMIIAPSLSLLLALCFDKIKVLPQILLSVLRCLGSASLEILLISDYIFAHSDVIRINVLPNFANAILTIIMSLIGGLLFHYMIDLIKKILMSYSHSD